MSAGLTGRDADALRLGRFGRGRRAEAERWAN